MKQLKATEYLDGSEIAIVGLAGRFPGAPDVAAYWRNLREGVESITRFTDEQLLAAGISPATVAHPHYVKARPQLEGVEWFDAAFFGFSPREAEIMDPQQRLFLECVWEALEQAGYVPDHFAGPISVFGGVSASSYLTNHLYANPQALAQAGMFQTFLSNVQDSLATRVAYKLNLKGACYSVQTFCSTSLVAVHLACQSLADLECDLAVAGGVSINVPQHVGYWFQEGGILSPDGHCRPFDAKAQGTLFGNGLGVVILKRLEEALADGDFIHAVIKGSATNNDGSLKVSYTAPSVAGQAQVIVEALANADVAPDTIAYVETHGTGTALGDPTEMAALTKAFRSGTQKKGYCAIGSVKSNIGHLDAAAGIASLIKAVLALQHRQIPPSLNYETPNPEIDFPNSPFRVNAKLAEWPRQGVPRRAGVSSFGIGGTNAHVILQEAPPREPAAPSRRWQVLPLSARTETALQAATANLVSHFKQHPTLSLADAAFTLQAGRKAFGHRRLVVAQSPEDAAGALEAGDPKRVFTVHQEHRNPPVVFMFPGQGSQYVNMGLELYQTESVYRERLDACAELLRPHLGFDLRQVLHPPADQLEAAAAKLNQTAITQPALFAVEYALARLWMSWGIQPQAMIGHSLGEYVAACLAGVFSLADALKLVAGRAALMQALPAGTMLIVPASAADLEPLLRAADPENRLSIAAVNGPSLCVVSGESEVVKQAQAKFQAAGIEGRALHTSHAFHSRMMEPMLEPFAALLKQVALKPPAIPYVSNLTGTWITEAEATDPHYWTRHLRNTVRFSDGMQELLKESPRILLEVGPGQTLCALARQHRLTGQTTIPSVRHPQEQGSDVAFLLTALGRLWLAGKEVDWKAFHGAERRQRMPLPTYPFERQRYWIEPQKNAGAAGARARGLQKRGNVSAWFYVPVWKSAVAPAVIAAGQPREEKHAWLVFVDEGGVGAGLCERLAGDGHRVIRVRAGDGFAGSETDGYTLNPESFEDYSKLLEALQRTGQLPRRIVHLWSVGGPTEQGDSGEWFRQCQHRGLYSLLFLVQAYGKHGWPDSVRLHVVSNQVQEVTAEEELSPAKATILAAARVIPQELGQVALSHIDVEWRDADGRPPRELADRLLGELLAEKLEPAVAWRGRQRWVQTFEPFPLEQPAEGQTRLRENGTYLITGGLGGLGLVFADFLGRRFKAKLVLTGRSGLPAPGEWNAWLAAHGEQDSTSRKILKVRALEAHGAEVLTLAADVADEGQMRSVVAQTQARFGQLHGVIHAAGILEKDTFRPVEELRPSECERQFKPKVQGVLVLEKVLAGVPLDFCLLTSSLSSVLGGLNYCAYAAANLFMDAFVRRHQRAGGPPWIAVNWDEWQFGEEAGEPSAMVSAVAKAAIRPAEGMAAFERMLQARQLPQMVVSTSDLQVRIDQWVKLEALHESDAAAKAEPAVLHTRPNLSTAYVAPENEVEKTIAEIWQKLLGIERVGLKDNFFELGGHSLLGTQLISRLRKAFGIELPLRSIFEATTVAELAKRVQAILWLAQNQTAAPAAADEEREEIEL